MPKMQQNPVSQACIESHKYTSECCATTAEHKSHVSDSWKVDLTSVPKDGF